MFSYQVDIYEKQNGAWGWHTLSGWTRPFTDGTRLDETLDSGTINLSNVTRDKAIKPFTRLRIIVSENNVEKERIYRLVASTRRKRKRYAGTPLYDWTINTIELTKLLERRLIDTMTVTKIIIQEYNTEANAQPVISGTAGGAVNIGTVPTYKQAYVIGTTINIPDASTWMSLNIPPTGSYSWVVAPHNTITYNGATATNVLNQEGTYIITTSATWQYTRGDATTTQKLDYTWVIGCFNPLREKAQPTISSVCNRLLSAGVTMRKGVESQEFLLDPTFESEYENVLSPEFSFTNSTLFEALLQIGGYIHAIPRLVPIPNYDVRYYVTFDKLGGDEQAPTMPPFIYSENMIDVNDWCGQLDTPAQNLVNTEDVNAGSITELGNSFITVRTEDGQVEINADDVLIRVSKPIQQILKVECVIGTTNTVVGDITPYIYESAEYLTLSSYWGTSYPYSKGWALHYSQGGDTIGGLSFRLTDATSVATAFQNYAIVNIINAKIGTSYGVVDGEFMRKLAFRVTYVPIAQARVKAHKPSLAEGGAVNNALTYNQSANIAETSYYGEKMRGAIARLGHDVETRTYDIFHYEQLPKIGQLLDGKYIAHIDYEWDITKVRITVALTKDFNMLSQFVGLNSNYRLYDISEKQSVERNVNYDELVVVGDAPNVNMDKYLMIGGNVSSILIALFLRVRNFDRKIKVARLTPYDSNGNEIPNRACILPVVAFPFGTSIALNVSYFDNYGAGYQQSNAYEDGGANKAVQRLVPYTDSLGEIKYLKVTFDKETGWTQNSTSAYDDNNSPAMLYPQLTTADSGSNYVTTGDNYIDLQKDSREIINFTYQLHFVASRASIVIGSGIAKYCYLVSVADTTTQAVIIWKKTTLNGLNKYITVDDVQPTALPLPAGGEFDPNAYTDRPQGSDYKAYAVCMPVTVGEDTRYELLFGENIDNTLETLPTVTFAGALMQACNQDEPNRLKFAKAGTSYWYLLPSIGSGGVMGTLSDDCLPDYENPIVYGGGTQYQSVYYPIPGVYGTPPGSTVQKQAYVLASDLVTAYDFE